MVAEGLGRLIRDEVELIGMVNDGTRLVQEARRLQPDIVVTDLAMPGLSGIDAMRQLKPELPRARFIILTIHGEPRLAAEALRSGAAGYVLKHAAGEELIDAIRAVAAGETYLTPHIASDALRALAHLRFRP